MKKLLLFYLFLISFASLFAKDIVIYHTSDTHGYYFAAPNKNGQMQGGMAALASFIKKDSSGNANFLLLDSGDFMQGNLEANASKGLASARAFNALGYHALTIGNHEFDFNKSLDEVAALLNADILAANFPCVNKALPFKIYQIDGVKIAVIGIALNGEKNKSYPELDIYAAYKNALEAAYTQNPHAVVLLIHSTNSDKFKNIVSSKDLIGSAPYKIDVSLGGHMHLKEITKNKETLFVESGAMLQDVSKITLTFDDNTNQLTASRAKTYPLILDKTGEDPQVKEIIETLRNPENDEFICTSSKCLLLESGKEGVLDSRLSNFVAGALLKEIPPGADPLKTIALFNTNAIRKDIPKGEIRKRDIHQAMPFDNRVSVMRVKGEFLENLIKSTISPQRSLYQYSGLKIKALFEEGNLTKLKIKVNGKPLDRGETYTVVTIEYIAFGASGSAGAFKDISGRDKELTDKSFKEALIESLKNPQDVPTGLGNIKVKSK